MTSPQPLESRFTRLEATLERIATLQEANTQAISYLRASQEANTQAISDLRASQAQLGQRLDSFIYEAQRLFTQQGSILARLDAGNESLRALMQQHDRQIQANQTETQARLNRVESRLDRVEARLDAGDQHS